MSHSQRWTLAVLAILLAISPVVRAQGTGGHGGGGTPNSAPVTKTGSYASVTSDFSSSFCTPFLMNSGAALNYTLPGTAPAAGTCVSIENIGAGILTIQNNGRNIDGAAGTVTVNQNTGLIVQSDGTNYVTNRGIGGGGLANPMTTLGDIIAENATPAPARVAGPTTPNGVPETLINTPSGGLAQLPAWALSGVLPDPQTGITYTVAVTDRSGYVSFSNAAAIAVTLPQAGTAGFGSNFSFVACDIGAGTATITPTTSTISYSNGSAYTSAAANVALTTGQCITIYSDNTNYFGIFKTGGSASGVYTIVGFNQLAANGTTNYGSNLGQGGGNAITPAGSAGTVAQFYAVSSAAFGVGNTLAFTVFKNGVGQTVTCSISGASATSCSDTAHSFTFVATDTIGIQTVCTGTCNVPSIGSSIKVTGAN